MNMLLARIIVAAVLVAVPLAAAPPVFAQEGGGAEQSEGGGGIDFLGGPDWDTVKDRTAWALVGTVVFATVLGVLYLFKRKVGGFPEHPTWVAPISIMRASDLPADDDDTGHEDHMGHDAHGGHSSGAQASAH